MEENLAEQPSAVSSELKDEKQSRTMEEKVKDTKGQDVPQIYPVPSDFFDDFKLSPMPEKHFSLTPDLEDRAIRYLHNDMGFKFKPEEVDMTQILAADHPLLERFQRLLREQLEKKIYDMREEVGNLLEGCKLKKTENDALITEGKKTKSLASQLAQTTQTCLQDCENATAAREELDFQLAKVLEELDYEKDENMNSEGDEIAIRAEMESVDLLMKQMESWERELESDLMINQRVMEHTTKTKIELKNEQKQLDGIIFKTMKEVWKLECEVDKIQMQIRVKEESRERLAEAVALSNIDIEANQTEYRCLLQGFQSVLVVINQRDKYYNSLQGQMLKYDDLLSSVNCALLNIKKEIQKEHIENERWTMIKERLEYDMKNVSKMLLDEEGKREESLKIIAKYDKFLEENLKQRDMIKAEILVLKEDEAALSRQLEEANQSKYQLEQEILANVHSSAFNGDACRQMTNILKDYKEENRRQRINIARVEGQMSRTHADYQFLINENAAVNDQLKEMKLIIAKEDEQLLNINRDFEQSEKLVCKNILLVEQLKVKAQEAAAAQIEMWPEEVKIRHLEASNAVLIEKNQQAQSFWLREQSVVVELSQKRQAQMKEVDLLKKQICVMDQKHLRINDTLENLANLDASLTKNIIAYESKMNFYTAGLHKKKSNKASLNLANEKIKSEIQDKLEDSEFETLRLKAEIIEIEDDKYALSSELIEKNREALCWEKKLLLALDTRKQMHESQSENGELSQMRTEIHRMNVRYSQLKKAQDKLIHDLDNCLYRRESIVTLAESRTRGHKGGSQQWRVNFNKRKDDLKNKMTQTDQELEVTQKKSEAKVTEIEECQKGLKTQKEKLVTLEKVRSAMFERLEEVKVYQQLGLDVMLYKQRKLKMYIELSRGRTPYLRYKIERVAHEAYVRERTLNTKLRVIVEDLQTDLPQHNHFLTKCHNLLTLPAVKL